MSTSRTSIPSRASWPFSRRQNPHHRVVYILSGSGTAASFPVWAIPHWLTRNGAAGFPLRAGTCARMSVVRRTVVSAEQQQQPSHGGDPDAAVAAGGAEAVLAAL